MEKIKQLLTNDFERSLLDAALENLSESGNKLRLNNFAYAIRELSRHFLHNLAPERNVHGTNMRQKTAILAEGNG